MKREWVFDEPVLRMLGALRAIVLLSADCNIQFRSVKTGILHEARVRSTANYPVKEKGWCSRVWRYRQARCKSTWEGIVRRTIAGRKTVCDVCHAGLQLFSIPVFVNNRLIGMLLCSQIPHKSEGSSFKKLLTYVRDLPVPESEWKARYRMTGSFPTARMTEILEQCRIATEGALSFTRNRGKDARITPLQPDDFIQPSLEPTPVPPGIETLVERAKRYLGQHPHERVSLHALASALECSPITLTRKFRKTTGTTIPSFLNMLRVKEAGELLSTSALSMAEITQKLGFADSRIFRRVFRKSAGQSPQDYRQKRWLKSRGL